MTQGWWRTIKLELFSYFDKSIPVEAQSVA